MTLRRIFVYVVLILSICLGSHVFPQNEAEDIQSQIVALKDSLRQEPENTGILLKMGILYHNLGVEGDKKAVKRARKLFQKLLELDPQNAEALAWYGSVLTLRGRDVWFPASKLKHVSNGIEKMDKAVELVPDNINVRMIRAHNSLNLPGIFHRTKIAITDFEHLLTLRKKRRQICLFGYVINAGLNIRDDADNPCVRNVVHQKANTLKRVNE